jgi:hypothetical protein
MDGGSGGNIAVVGDGVVKGDGDVLLAKTFFMC